MQRFLSAAQNQFALLPGTPARERKGIPRTERQSACFRLFRTFSNSAALRGSGMPPILPSIAANPKKHSLVPTARIETATREESVPRPDDLVHIPVAIPVRSCFSHRKDCHRESRASRLPSIELSRAGSHLLESYPCG